MEHLPFACLCPHGWLTIPLLSGEERFKATDTRAAMEELGRRVAAAQPETIVVVTPHGLMVEGQVSLLDSPQMRGDTFGMPWTENSPHGFALEFEADRDLNAALAEAARGMDVPTVRVSNHASWLPLTIDFGSLIPLWYLGAPLLPRPKVVIACADRGEHGLPFDASYRLGKAIREAAEASGRRIVLIASGDLGHGHQEDGPYGFEPVSKEFDDALTAALKDGDLARIKDFDEAWVRRALTDAYGPLMTLLGATEGTDMRGEFLSYEAPTYFGMACAAFG